MNGIKIQELLEQLYPISYSEDWDNVGLQVGTMNKDITGILVSLDLTIEVIKEAIECESNLIICHHPAIFSPLKTKDSETYLGRMIQKLIKKDITLYVMHTNYDVSKFGMNYVLGEKLGVQITEFLEEIDEDYGLGVVGFIKKMKVIDFIEDIKTKFGLESVRYIGDVNSLIERVAVLGGSGSSYIYQAVEKKVDLFITGDVTYHKALDAKNYGLNVLDIGHHFESNGIIELKNILLSKGIKVPIKVSEVITNPYKLL